MTQDLFSTAGDLQVLPVVDAEIYYLASMQLRETPQVLMRSFIESVPWRSEEIVVWGKKYQQPRLIAWYGDEGQAYSYSGIRLEPMTWTDQLLSIRKEVERVADAKFNSVLLNYYRDHNDSMGFHSDDEPELGPRSAIASVSFGERRTFILKHKSKKELKPVKLLLDSGSLLLMKGDTQRNWKHGIDKESRPCGPQRVNLNVPPNLPAGAEGNQPAMNRGWKSTRMPLQYAEKVNAARSGMARAAAKSGRDSIKEVKDRSEAGARSRSLVITFLAPNRRTGRLVHLFDSPLTR